MRMMPPKRGGWPQYFFWGPALAVVLLVTDRTPGQPAEDQVASARQWLRQAGVDDGQLLRFQDGLLLRPDESAPLLKILYRLPGLSEDLLRKWSAPQPSGELLSEFPGQYRGGLFELEGRIERLESVALTSQEETLWDFGRYFRVTLNRDDDSHPTVLLVREIPRMWKRRLAEDPANGENVRAHGLFLKIGRSSDGSEHLLFAAPRLAWHPQQPNAKLGVTESHVWLAQLGMDVGLFDQVRDHQPLVAHDRECFYQLLAAVGRADASRLQERTAGADSPLRTLLTEYDDQRGNFVVLEGRARRAVKIPVEDPDIQRRFGFDHYYEINMFVDTSVVIRDKQKDKEAKAFNYYPIVYCLRQLPEGMPAGEEINERVRIGGFFLKLYAYRTEFMATSDGKGRQYSPLVVGLEPEWIPYRRPTYPRLGMLMGGVFIVLLLGICYGLWKYRQGDERFRRSMLLRRRGSPEERSLDDLDLGD